MDLSTNPNPFEWGVERKSETASQPAPQPETVDAVKTIKKMSSEVNAISQMLVDMRRELDSITATATDD
jgi:hypothetical protein